MKNLTKMGFTLLTCAVLSACGSSGGGEDTLTRLTDSSIPASALTGATTTSNATGGVSLDTVQNDDLIITHKVLTDASRLSSHIVVDGQAVEIATANGATWGNTYTHYTCCGAYKDLRFGFINTTNLEQTGYRFYNGNPTTSMPTSGIATYNGHFAVAGDEYPQFDEEDYLIGTAKFTADFGAKKLVGTLSEKSLQPIEMTAAITGNNFIGEAKSASFLPTAQVEGKFYGENAKELGGLFESKNSRIEQYWSGVFGASQ